MPLEPIHTLIKRNIIKKKKKKKKKKKRTYETIM